MGPESQRSFQDDLLEEAGTEDHEKTAEELFTFDNLRRSRVEGSSEED